MATTQQYSVTHLNHVNILSYKTSPTRQAKKLTKKTTDTAAKYEWGNIRDPNRTERGTDT
jgi:hypothetical protein